MRIKIVTFNKELEEIIEDKYKNEDPELIVPIGGNGTFIYSIQKKLDLIKHITPYFLLSWNFFKSLNIT